MTHDVREIKAEAMLADEALAQLGASDTKADLEWQGMQMFVDHGVPKPIPGWQRSINILKPIFLTSSSY